MPRYFLDPRGTGNILDLSSAALESSNKTTRYSIKLRTYRGDPDKMMSGSLKYTYLKSTIKFRKHIADIDVSNLSIQNNDEDTDESDAEDDTSNENSELHAFENSESN